MKRGVEEVEVLFVYEILPPELWPGILGYLSQFQRNRFRTVCKRWTEPGGLIDQSVTRLKQKNLFYVDLKDMRNLTCLTTGYTSSLVDSIRDGKLKRLEEADFSERIYAQGCLSAISGLSNLTRLKLSCNLSDCLSILPSLGLLCSLEIQNTYIPIPKFNTLKYMTSLTQLCVSHATIDEEDLTKLKELRHLDLCNTTVSAKCIETMTMLESLALYDMKMCTPGVLRYLTRLTALDISGNDFIDDDEINHLTALRSLDVRENSRVTSDVLLNFRHLTRLLLSDDQSDCNSMEDARLSLNLSRMTRLRELHFRPDRDSSVCNETLSCLTALRVLHIFNNTGNITHDSLSLLVNLTDLKLENLFLAHLDVSLLPVSLRSVNLNDSEDWMDKMPSLLTRLADLVELTLGMYYVYDCTQECLEKTREHRTLERIWYDPYKVCRKTDKTYLDCVPEHIELIHTR